MSIKNLILCGFPPLAVGGTGVGIWKLAPRNEEETSISEWEWSGIKEGKDAEQTEEEAKDLIRQAGLNCGDATTETNCSIGTKGLNVQIGGVKKEGLFPSEAHNGNIKLRLSATENFNNKFRFAVIEKPIKLESKSNPNETITLDKYENYEVVKDSETNIVYLKRKLTKEEWIKKSLGLPNKCNLPAVKSPNSLDFSNLTCEISNTEIKSVNFDGKKEGGVSTTDKVKLYIHKVSDTKTFPEGYKFTFHPHKDVNINNNDKFKANIWKDFKLKKPNEETDDFVLERVWKSESDLLDAIGLSCGENGECTVKDGSLKIKVGTKYIKDGKRKTDEGTGTLKLLREKSGHYEGLRFEIHGGEVIKIESSASPDSTVQMQELEVFHVKKQDSDDSSFLLGRKHDLEEMILYHLGLNKNGCSLPKEGKTKNCTVQKDNLKNIKIHESGGEKKITGDNSLFIIITAVAEEEKSKYPLGYKFSLSPDGEMKIESTTLNANTSYDFKIKKESGPKLYLERVS